MPGGRPGRGLAATVASLRRLADHDAVRHDLPLALAVSASGREVFPATADGRPLGPCLRTGDARTASPDAAAIVDHTLERWIRACGHVPDRMDPTNRLLWWRQQRPGSLGRARRFLNWHEWVTLRLVGQAVTDRALAAGFMLYDLDVHDWSEARLAALDLDRALMPDAAWATSLGPVGRAAAASSACPTTAMSSSAASTPRAPPWGRARSPLGVPLLACGSWESLVAPAGRLRLAAIARTGMALPAPRACQAPACSPVARTAPQRSTGPGASRACRCAPSTGGSSTPGPTVAGGRHPPPRQGERALGGPAGPGCWSATLASTPLDVVKAVLEGIARDLEITRRALERAGAPVGAWRTSGGGRSRWWMQLKADLTGVPVEVTADAEAGAPRCRHAGGDGHRGVRLHGGGGPGAPRTTRRREPDPARAARCAERLAAHERLVPTLLAGQGASPVTMRSAARTGTGHAPARPSR